MKLKFSLALLVLLTSSLFTAPVCFAAEGLVKIESQHSVSKTIDRLENILKDKGFKIIARIDHGDAAANVGVELRETELIIFGNPKAGSPLMACQQSVAIDLPQKALAIRDEDGKVWLAYNDPAFLDHRHGLEGCDRVLAKVSSTLKNFTEAAAQ